MSHVPVADALASNKGRTFLCIGSATIVIFPCVIAILVGIYLLQREIFYFSFVKYLNNN